MDFDYDEEGNPKLKIILIGEKEIGKTQLINIMNDTKFDEDYKTTLSTTFLEKYIQIGKNIIHTFIWDTMGEEKTRAMLDIFYKGSKIVILVYAVNNKSSFEELNEYWVDKIKEKLGNDIILGLVGNKNDLYKDKEVTDQEGEKYAADIGAKFLCTSAKTENGRKAFKKYVCELIAEYFNKVQNKTKGKIEKRVTAKLDPKKIDNKGRKCC